MKTYLFLAAAIALAGAAAACSTRADDASLGAVNLKHSSKDSTSGDDDDDDDDDDTGSSSSAVTNTPGVSSGGAPSSTATTPAPPPPVDPFAGAAAFTQITPKTDTTQHHLGDNNAGKDCLACHGANNGAPTFEFAGTVRTAAGAASDGATGVQIRIVDPSGKEVGLVGSDSQGNFWLLGTGTIPAGSHVGVRNGSTEKKMSATIGAGSCNTSGCHDPTRPIFIGDAAATTTTGG